MIILILSLAVALCFATLAAYAWMRWQRLAHDVRALTAQLGALAAQDADRRGSVLVKSRERVTRELAAAANKLLASDARQLSARADEAASLEGVMQTLSGALEPPASALADHVEALTRQAQDTVLPDDLRTRIAETQAQAGALTAKMARVADLAAVKSGRLALSPVPTALTALAEETLARFAPRLEAAGVYVETDWPAAPLTLAVDPDAVARILAIFIDNVLSHGASGGYLRLALAETADGASLTVEDHGPGLDEAKRAQLFTGGAQGLGLPLAAGLADAIGAQITCDSLPHLCTMFTLWLKNDEKEEAVA